jgi:hypothetical protein
MQPRTREANPAQLVERLDALIDLDDRSVIAISRTPVKVDQIARYQRSEKL